MRTGHATPEGLTRAIRTAELLAVGSELTTGETRDTNGPELAGALTEAGVAIRGIFALPDDLPLVTDRFREALGAVDLVLATGGLGPTPDDLTREAVAAALGEEPTVDPELEAWLRALFERRGMRLAEVNLKQAWRIPSATAIPNPNGTAPGWWVDAMDGRVVVLLPGPPREMRPMWRDWVLPRLRERGLGDGRLVRTLRTYGIGESMVVDRLGEALFRQSNPVVATYARADWLDIRISAVDEPATDGRRARPAAAIVAETAEHIRAGLSGHVWAEGETSWAELVAGALADAGPDLATVEAGSNGELGRLLADVVALARSEARAGEAAAALEAGLAEAAVAAARGAGTALGLALVARPADAGTVVRVAVARPDRDWSRRLELRLFQHGAHGRFRAAVAAAAFLIETLAEGPEPASHAVKRA